MRSVNEDTKGGWDKVEQNMRGIWDRQCIKIRLRGRTHSGCGYGVKMWDTESASKYSGDVAEWVWIQCEDVGHGGDVAE